jgi:hypothetical protein
MLIQTKSRQTRAPSVRFNPLDALRECCGGNRDDSRCTEHFLVYCQCALVERARIGKVALGPVHKQLSHSLQTRFDLAYQLYMGVAAYQSYLEISLLALILARKVSWPKSA